MALAPATRRQRRIDVVAVWHWVLSITHREDGVLVMPNGPALFLAPLIALFAPFELQLRPGGVVHRPQE